MRRLLWAAPIATLALAAGLAAAAEPKTALGRWMRPNMSRALADQDFATMRKSFVLVAKSPPSSDYAEWVTLARNGAKAASRRDLGGVKAACKGCHDAYKSKYAHEYPNRPFP
jgi:hypothetical protein